MTVIKHEQVVISRNVHEHNYGLGNGAYQALFIICGHTNYELSPIIRKDFLDVLAISVVFYMFHRKYV